LWGRHSRPLPTRSPCSQRTAALTLSWCVQETDEKALRPHGCATCAPGAWRLCEECHISLLSRDCPVCRSPYQSLELFPFPFSETPPPEIEWRVFEAVVQRNVNVCMWNAATRQASFMLAPACPGAPGPPGSHVAIAGACPGPIPSGLRSTPSTPLHSVTSLLVIDSLKYAAGTGVDLGDHSFGTSEQGGQTRFLFDTRFRVSSLGFRV